MKNLTDMVARLSSLMGQMEDSAREQYNLSSLTLTQMHYLEVISKLDNPNITELAHAMKLTKPTVKVAIDKLIEKDYVLKIQSDEDRRSAHLHLTEKGKLINQMHDYAHKRIAEFIGNKLNQDEQDQIFRLLDKITGDE